MKQWAMKRPRDMASLHAAPNCCGPLCLASPNFSGLYVIMNTATFLLMHARLRTCLVVCSRAVGHLLRSSSNCTAASCCIHTPPFGESFGHLNSSRQADRRRPTPGLGAPQHETWQALFCFKSSIRSEKSVGPRGSGAVQEKVSKLSTPARGPTRLCCGPRPTPFMQQAS